MIVCKQMLAFFLQTSDFQLSVRAAGDVDDAFAALECLADAHPVAKWFEADPEMRKSCLSAPEIIGLAMIDLDCVIRFISLPRLITDTTSGRQKICGSAGKTRSNVAPVSVDTRSLLDALVLTTKAVPEGTLVGGTSEISEGLKAKSHKSDADATLIKTPLLSPLVPHHPLKEGKLSDNLVREGLSECHPLAGAWMDGIDGFVTSAVKKQNAQKLVLAERSVPNLAENAKPATTMEVVLFSPDLNSAFQQAEQDVKAVRDKNEEARYEASPEDHQSSSRILVDRDPLGVEDALDGDVKTTSSAKKLCVEQISPALRLLGAIMRPATKNVALPPLREELIQLFEGRTSSTITSDVKSGLETLADERNSSRDCLIREVDTPHASQVVVTLLTNQRWKLTPLDEETGALDKQLSILSFLAPPIEGANEERQKLFQNLTSNALEEETEQPTKHRSEISLKLFMEGRQDELADAATLLANLDCARSFSFDYDD